MSNPVSVWLRGLLKGNPELYRQIYDWNLYPHRWARPDWLVSVPGAEGALVSLLERTSEGRARLGTHFRESLGLSDTFWDFEPRQRRLALLPANTLAQLARFAGATYYWNSLTRVVSQQRHQALTARIGADAHAFAMRRGRSLLSTTGLTPPGVSGRPDPDRMHAAGWTVIASCLTGEPAALLTRTRFKFPRGLTLEENLPPAQAWNLLQPILSETLPTSDRPCFA